MWRFADPSNKIVIRTNSDGSQESRLVQDGDNPLPFEPIIKTPEEQIIELESLISPRRIREAILSNDYSFIEDINSQIENLRKNL